MVGLGRFQQVGEHSARQEMRYEPGVLTDTIFFGEVLFRVDPSLKKKYIKICPAPLLIDA